MANRQHYELPAEFFELILGRHRKYSCCLWDQHANSLDAAEATALRATCQNADVRDGMRILELGCGWGSLALWIAEHFSDTHVTAVSNSQSQRRYIQQQAVQRGLADQLTVVTADMNEFETDARFDRVVSVEMFEHMRNHALLLRRIAGWLVDNGKLFVHIFCHKNRTYEFLDTGPADWISRYFFTGGVMPGYDLLKRYRQDMQQVRTWQWNGLHYQQTADAWLANLNARQPQVRAIFRHVYGQADAGHWLQRWRIFFMACSELFGYDLGREWFVAHALFAPQPVTGTTGRPIQTGMIDDEKTSHAETGRESDTSQ